jgi:hypothetical protein
MLDARLWNARVTSVQRKNPTTIPSAEFVIAPPATARPPKNISAKKTNMLANRDTVFTGYRTRRVSSLWPRARISGVIFRRDAPVPERSEAEA